MNQGYLAFTVKLLITAFPMVFCLVMTGICLYNKRKRENDYSFAYKAIIRKGMHGYLMIILGILFFFIWIAMVLDFYPPIHDYIKYHVFAHWSDQRIQYIKDLKGTIVGNLELVSFHSFVVSMESMLLAAVVFYYSVQDNRTAGIPYRTIMGYSIGVNTVPYYFTLTLIATPLSYISSSMRLYWITCILLIMIFLMQLVVMVTILMSTSYRYSVVVILRVEVRQFRLLSRMIRQEQSANSGKLREQKFSHVKEESVNHLREIVQSNALESEKFPLIRYLVKVPFYSETSVQCFSSLWKMIMSFPPEIKLSECCVRNKAPESVYEFYYKNLLPVFESLQKNQDRHMIDKMQDFLCELIEELSDTYNQVTHKTENLHMNYYMTIMGIINALMAAEVPNAGAYFNRILTQNIRWPKERNQLLTLYFLALEYLYRCDRDTAEKFLNDIYRIQELETWNYSVWEKPICQRSWDIWNKMTTMQQADSYDCLNNALNVLNGKVPQYPNSAVAFVYRVILQKKGKP